MRFSGFAIAQNAQFSLWAMEVKPSGAWVTWKVWLIHATDCAFMPANSGLLTSKSTGMRPYSRWAARSTVPPRV